MPSDCGKQAATENFGSQINEIKNSMKMKQTRLYINELKSTQWHRSWPASSSLTAK